MNAKRCCIEKCESSADRAKDRGVTFHRLPKTSELRTKWLIQARLEDADDKCRFVCSRHFRKVDFRECKPSKFALKQCAIPTIFSWGATPLHELDRIFGNMVQRTSSNKTDGEKLLEMESRSELFKCDETKSVTETVRDEDNVDENPKSCETNPKSESATLNDEIIKKCDSNSSLIPDVSDVEHGETLKTDEPKSMVNAPRRMNTNEITANSDKTHIIEQNISKDDRMRVQSPADRLESAQDEIDRIVTKQSSSSELKQKENISDEIEIEHSVSDKSEILMDDIDEARNVEIIKSQETVSDKLESKLVNIDGTVTDRSSLNELQQENISNKIATKSSKSDKSEICTNNINKVKNDEIVKPQEIQIECNVNGVSYQESRPNSITEMEHDSTVTPDVESALEKLFQSEKDDPPSSPSVNDSQEKNVNENEITALKENDSFTTNDEIVVKPKQKIGRPRRSSPIRHKISSPKSKAGRPKKKYNTVDCDIVNNVAVSPTKCDKGMLAQGSRVEAKDFNDKWYPARVVEIDHEDEEVLIHYDKWSQRFDEWISVNSSRLRLIQPPPPVSSSPPTFAVGERCYARWSNNQRFPATVKRVLPNDKYEVMFDDGLTRTIKWVMMSRGVGRRSSSASSSPVTSSSPLAPAPVLESQPPPLHTHLFDPNRDHLGTKEERRHMKKLIDVKTLFAARRKRKIIEGNLDSKKDIKVGRGRKRKLKVLEDGENIEKVRKKPGPLKGYKRKTVIVSPEIEIMKNSKILSTSKSVVPDEYTKPNVSMNNEIKSSTSNTFSPSHDNKLKLSVPSKQPETQLTNKTPALQKPKSQLKMALNSQDMDTSTQDCYVKMSPIKHTVKEKCDTSNTVIKDDIKAEVGLPSATLSNSVISESSVSSDSLLPSDDIKTPILSMNNTSVLSPSLNNSHVSQTKSSKTTNPYKAAEKDWCCYWVNGLPHGKRVELKKTKNSSIDRVTIQVEDNRLPPNWTKLLTRKISGVNKGKWDVILVCPSGRRYRTRGEMQERLLESEDLVPYAVGLMDFSAHRKQARRRGWDIVLPDDAPIDNQSNSSLSNNTVVTPNRDPNVVYIGSLKVQIIENLLRCPKEGCFKNFRKENLLQMHIKHYHPEMCKFFGDTPNVADLAYARTVVEEAATTPVKVKHEFDKPIKPRERKISEIQHYIKNEFNSTSIKKEISDMDDTFSNLQEPVAIHKSNTNFNGEMHGLDYYPIKQSMSPDNRIMNTEILSPFHLNKSKHIDVKNSIKQNIQIKREEFSKSYFNKSFNESVKKSNKKRSLDVLDDVQLKKKKILDETDTWNDFPPVQNETKSSFDPVITDDSIIKLEPLPNIKEEMNDGGQSMFITESGEKIKIVHMKREEIINCHCKFGEEDGLMIQCDLCLCWQHALCHKIEKESEVPEKYICAICLNPYRGRRSQKYLHQQEWLYEGKLPRAFDRVLPVDAARSSFLQKTHELAGNLSALKDLMHSLRCKIEVAEKKDHPKLYLWSKSWEENADIVKDTKISEQINSQTNLPNRDLPKIKDVYSLTECDMIPMDVIEEQVIIKTDSTNASEISSCLESSNVNVSDNQVLDIELTCPNIKTITDENQQSNNQALDIELTCPNVEPITSENQSDNQGMDIELACPNIEPITSDNQSNNQAMDIELTSPDDKPIVSENQQNENQSQSIDEMKSENINNACSTTLMSNLLMSPGGTTLDLPISNAELETLAKTVQISAPQPEAAIEPSECRLRLLQHIEKTQLMIDARLDSIEAQVVELESLDPTYDEEDTPERFPRTKQTLQMLIRDLAKLEELYTYYKPSNISKCLDS